MRSSVLCYPLLLALSAVVEARCTTTFRNISNQQETSEELSQLEQRLHERDEAKCALLDERLQRIEERLAALEITSRPPTKEDGDSRADGQLDTNQLEERLQKVEAAARRVLEHLHLKDLLEQMGESSTTEMTMTEENWDRQWVELRIEATKKRMERAQKAPSRLGEQLCKAANQGKLEEVRSLLDKGADVNYINRHGEFPLGAVFDSVHGWGSNDPAVVSLLLEKGADPNARDASGGVSALHFAASEGQLRCVELLLGAGADVDGRDETGATPLHWAAARNKEEAVRVLLEAGARKDVVTWGGEWHGDTPFDVAKVDSAVRELLRP